MTKSVDIKYNYLKAVSLAMAKQDIRYHLMGVHVEARQDGVTLVATDGHRLLAIHDDTQRVEEPFSMIIPSETVKAIITNHKAPRSYKDDNYITIMNTDGNRRWAASAKFAGSIKIEFLAMDEEFPDWRRLVPQTPPTGVGAVVNPDYLVDMEKAASFAIGMPYKPGRVSLAYYGQEAIVVARSMSAPMVLGLVMPMRGMQWDGDIIPTWAR